ncbi:MAG: RelA/SpoT domain-containing protein [Bdellovibrionaceae bacterium]|jgi:putative GTP pyrophosphokinase|nr:RelA/SpoT domain-containing protein [Pseudobdellovibrionaceae bacterium]
MNNIITRSQIKNIGKSLRSIKTDQQLESSSLVLLNKWREHHDATLKYYGKLLKSEAIKLGIKPSQFTVTQRIKRIHSIILKLRRFPLMQLSTMDDVAGVRIVLPENSEVSHLVNVLKEKKSKHELIKLSNYTDHPKDDGYRSIHLVYRANKSPSIQIEIQLRSLLQHYWATGVEVFGTLEKTSFKTGEGSEDWRIFFKLLSSRFAIKEGTPVLEEHEKYSISQLNTSLVAMIRKLNIIEQLSAYTSIYTSNWREKRAIGRSGKYALITLDTNTNRTSVEVYPESQLSKALSKYSSIEKTHHSSNAINIVLVNLDNINNLERAYPNYFMDTKVLSNYLSKIVLGKF